jgi:uncharacterized membrane protein YvbJ
MDCSNPECGQVIEPGNKFCTECGAPVRKKESPPKLQMPSTSLEKLISVILASIIVVAGIVIFLLK